MTQLLRLVASALLVASLAMTGCGDKPDASAKARVEAKRDFSARARNVCHASPVLRPTDAPAATRVKARSLGRSAAEQLDAVRRLGAPEKDQALLERYFQSVERLVRALPGVEAAARLGAPAALRAATTSAAAAQRNAATLGRQYGLPACV